VVVLVVACSSVSAAATWLWRDVRGAQALFEATGVADGCGSADADAVVLRMLYRNGQTIRDALHVCAKDAFDAFLHVLRAMLVVVLEVVAPQLLNLLLNAVLTCVGCAWAVSMLGPAVARLQGFGTTAMVRSALDGGNASGGTAPDAHDLPQAPAAAAQRRSAEQPLPQAASAAGTPRASRTPSRRRA
jgi:hypothetical protein